jgi:hypothetical protein
MVAVDIGAAAAGGSLAGASHIYPFEWEDEVAPWKGAHCPSSQRA